MDILHVTIADIEVSPSPTARNLGVVLDDQLWCNANITSVARSCRIALYTTSREAAQVLVEALGITRLHSDIVSSVNLQLSRENIKLNSGMTLEGRGG